MAFKMKGFEPHNMYKTERADTHKEHLALKEKGYDHSPYNKKPEEAEEPIDGGTLDEVEVVEYTGTPREIKKKRRKHEGIGANWEIWKKKRQNRLNKNKADRSNELDFNPLS